MVVGVGLGGGFVFFLFPKRKKTDDEAESRGREGGREMKTMERRWMWEGVGEGGRWRGGGGWMACCSSTWDANKTRHQSGVLQGNTTTQRDERM